jgi:hypothetical protein
MQYIGNFKNSHLWYHIHGEEAVAYGLYIKSNPAVYM